MMLACNECAKRKACIIINGMAICEVCAIDLMCNILIDMKTRLDNIVKQLDYIISKEEVRREYGREEQA